MSVQVYLDYASDIVTIGGIIFVVLQMKRDASYASASAAASIIGNIRTALSDLGAAREANQIELFENRFKDLLNELELACAVVLDGVANSRTGKIATLLLLDVINEIQKHEELKARVAQAIHADHTFENLRDFVAKHKGALR